MNSKLPPITPSALRLGDALDQSAVLVRLRALLADSNARFEAIRPVLPPALLAHVKAGQVDDLGWTVLAANPAVASKLRQWQPRLEQTLREAAWTPSAIRIKVWTPER